MLVVSIHAPAWGATQLDSVYPGMRVFQSTLPRGERPTKAVRQVLDNLFQSTLPRGERRCPALPALLIPSVSIHAPAWGATLRREQRTSPQEGFNPRSRVGSDRLISKRLIMSNI